MKLLALETSSIACSVALKINAEIRVIHKIAPMQHAKLILPMINELLADASIKLNMLDAIAFGCGPGSFTGVRIASSVVQGLSFAQNLPVISVSSLAAIAQTAYNDHGAERVFVAVDARMKEIYCASYLLNTHQLMDLVGMETVCTPEEVPSLISFKGDYLGAGDGWLKYGDCLVKNLGVPAKIEGGQLPSATAIVQLASKKLENNEMMGPSEAIPVYLR